MPDLTVCAHGPVCASVCTRIQDDEEVTDRLNEELPTGIASRWQISKDEAFRTGEPNPHPCELQPKTRRHILFHCCGEHMKPDVAEALAMQLRQEDQYPSLFTDIELIDNDGPHDLVLVCTFASSVRLELNGIDYEDA